MEKLMSPDADELLLEIKREFEIIKRMKERELERYQASSGHKVTCICGNCKFPVWFTYKEIEEVLEKF
jgi:hypothetical protein